MEPVREAARSLANGGQICITQKGVTVDPQSFKGPIRLRLLEAKKNDPPAKKARKDCTGEE